MSDSKRNARRVFLRALGGLAVGALAPAAFAVPRVAYGAGLLELVNTHTGELLQVAHDGGVLSDARALPRLQHLLRDHRSGEEHAVDQLLFSQLVALAAGARVDARFEIISGYRSPATNEALHRKSNGVASHSLHLQGRALDVRLRGVNCLHLAELARASKAGGVGYYRHSDFVHVDTGDVRTWNGEI